MRKILFFTFNKMKKNDQDFVFIYDAHEFYLSYSTEL